MRRVLRAFWIPSIALSLLVTAFFTPPAKVSGTQIVNVSLSPAVVPVGTTAAVKSSLLVTATVAGVAPGTTSSCTVSLTEPPGGAVLSSKTVTTSPAPASGVTSLTTLFTIFGGAPAGLAQAALTCGGSTGSAPFRISSLVALNAAPLAVPAGGALSLTVLIATNAPLPLPAQCTLAVTDPAGSAPPLASQALSVSGGSAIAPASGATTVSVPATAAIGHANAAASCFISGAGTAGDSIDFTVTDPSQVTLVSPPVSAAPGGMLALSAITLPGLSCTAELTLPDGERVTSPAVIASATGAVAFVVSVPATAQPGSASLLVVCADPANPANSATSPAQPIAIAVVASALSTPSPTPLSLSAALINTLQPLAAGGHASLALTTVPAALCSLTSFLDPSGVEQPIADPSATGVAAADGTLTLSFQLSTSATSGSGLIDLTCAYGGARSTFGIFLVVGSPPVCGDLAASSAGNQPSGPVPVASAGGPYNGSAGEPIQFSGTGSQPSAGAVLTSCLWSFGDGQTATGLNPTHTYAVAGAYTSTLTVNDSDGLSATATATATVLGFVPLCSQPAITGSTALSACVSGLSCPATSIPDQCLPACATYTPLALAPDGPCPQPTTSARLATGGPYTAGVLQPIQFQATAIVSGTRRVCSADATLGQAGPICHLVPAASLPRATDYAWDFGDGATGSGARSVHAYATAGTFPVKLAVTFDDGSTATATTQATISGFTTSHQIVLNAGCNAVTPALRAAIPGPVLAGMVQGGHVRAIWAMTPGQPSAAWFPAAGAPNDLAVIGAGEAIWICVDSLATLTLPS